MSTIGERISFVIKEKHLRKTEVAKMIGIADASMSTICSGKNKPSNQTVRSISDKLGVDIVWLETGVGEPWKVMERDDIIADALGSALTGVKDKDRIIRALASLPDEAFESIADFVCDLAEAIKNSG